jgi:hypothetical protein
MTLLQELRKIDRNYWIYPVQDGQQVRLIYVKKGENIATTEMYLARQETRMLEILERDAIAASLRRSNVNG